MENKKNVLVLGGGVGGLAVAYYLSQTGHYNVTVLEKESVIGGLCGSFAYQGFTLDYGAHKLYSTLPGIMDEIINLSDGNILKLPKRNKIFLRNNLLEYPLKLSNLTKVLGLFELCKLGFGFLLEAVKSFMQHKPPCSYEQYMIKRFGKPAYELVFEPLANKVWGDPASLHAEMARVRVPASGGIDVILKLLGIKKETVATNADFFLYPRNGFGAFPQQLKQKIETASGKVIVDVMIKELVQENKQVVGVKTEIAGRAYYFPCDYLISTIPLQVFAQMLSNGGAPKLENRNLVLVYIFINRDLVLNDQWIFFPEKEYLFSRIFEQKQMDPTLGPENQTAICCDFTCDSKSSQWQMPDDALAQECIKGLIKTGFIKKEGVTGWLVKRFNDFYPRYGLDYESKLLDIIQEVKKTENVLLSGRVGMYNYNNCDHCLDMGKFIKDQLIKRETLQNILAALLQHVKNYKIVD